MEQIPLFSACQFREHCATWQQAVKQACMPLQRQGIVTPEYAQAIIRETEQHGPWYILSPAFALPHARPEDGVTSDKTHLSLLCLKEAVPFPENPEVRLIIVLAAASSNQHIERIQQLVGWLDEAEHLSQLTHVSSLAQLRATLSAANAVTPFDAPVAGK